MAKPSATPVRSNVVEMSAQLVPTSQSQKRIHTTIEAGEDAIATKDKTTIGSDRTLPVQNISILDLPPEMRNRIYEETLTHGRYERAVATPALLATCRQILEEAKGVFRANSTYTIKIATKAVGDRRMDICVEGDIAFEVGDDDKDLTGLTQVTDIWPKAVQQAPSITVVLDIERTNYADGKRVLSAVQRLLYGLVSCLSIGGQAKKVKVIWPSETEDIRQRWVFYPLAKLPPGTDLEIVHPTVEEVRKYITRLQKLPCVRYNQLALAELPSVPTSLKQKFRHLDRDNLDLVEAIVTKLAHALNEESLSASRDHRFMITVQTVQALDHLPPNAQNSAIQAIHEQWLHRYVAAPFAAEAFANQTQH